MDVLSGLGPMPSSIQQRAGGTRDTGSILFDDDKNISRKKQRHTGQRAVVKRHQFLKLRVSPLNRFLGIGVYLHQTSHFSFDSPATRLR